MSKNAKERSSGDSERRDRKQKRLRKEIRRKMASIEDMSKKQQQLSGSSQYFKAQMIEDSKWHLFPISKW